MEDIILENLQKACIFFLLIKGIGIIKAAHHYSYNYVIHFIACLLKKHSVGLL